MISILKKLFGRNSSDRAEQKAEAVEPPPPAAQTPPLPPLRAIPPAPRRQPPPPPPPPPAPRRPPPVPAYPNTYAAFSGHGRADIYDPALKHFQHGFRRGDPQTNTAWHLVRRQVIDHLLRLIVGSRWNNHLVLRGSLLLDAWWPGVAREPKDIDWVFVPSEIGLEDPMAGELFADLKSLVANSPVAGAATLNAGKIAEDDIWTYERASGHRIVFPWNAPDMPPGEVQMDVVFAQPLPCEAIETALTLSDGGKVTLQSATKELSLAWKILWLVTDMNPQGKDVYDATLLAEGISLDPNLLYQVLVEGEIHPRRIDMTMISRLADQYAMDWEPFRADYPWIEGTAQEWVQRLHEAMLPCLHMLTALRDRFGAGER